MELEALVLPQSFAFPFKNCPSCFPKQRDLLAIRECLQSFHAEISPEVLANLHFTRLDIYQMAGLCLNVGQENLGRNCSCNIKRRREPEGNRRMT